ncbi:MAG: hypothetical protein AAF563_20910 [Pseudomonadota bacterium]
MAQPEANFDILPQTANSESTSIGDPVGAGSDRFPANRRLRCLIARRRHAIIADHLKGNRHHGIKA